MGSCPTSYPIFRQWEEQVWYFSDSLDSDRVIYILYTYIIYINMYKKIRFMSEIQNCDEPMIGELRLTDYIMEHPAVSTLHMMRWPSMQDFWILDGDQLIIERWRTPIAWDIVLAIIDENFTVRQFQFHQGKPYLQAGNSWYGSIMPAQELRISGVVVGIVRKYH